MKLSKLLVPLLFMIPMTQAVEVGPAHTAGSSFHQARATLATFLNHMTFSAEEKHWFEQSAESLEKVIYFNGTDREAALALLVELEMNTTCFLQVTDQNQFNRHMGTLYLLVADNDIKKQKLKQFHEFLQIPGIRPADNKHCN
ncbi:hypothetical protein [Alishewanella sp. SMS8]|uniref:hypothetical protein n=1 Tax=unclassified Alishewanella TaxID=2628974 RepID=UPI0027418939|nr:hypothetical protein [Alishewanella sp. SMS8]MDP5034657.1 hypothetical protein [Alishewanella sp.]MDP5460338.1 hypothetical protein [Alishewanella sp. SMS8]